MSATAGQPQVRIGKLWVDAVTSAQALARIEALVDGQHGGCVFTPNVDHVVVAERSLAFHAAYARAELVVADGQLVVWASHLLGHPLPEKVSGSDLLVPLLELAARRKFRVYLLGGGPGVAEAGAGKMRRELGAEVCGVSSARLGLTCSADEDALVAGIAATRPQLLLLFLGAPKGELFAARARDRLGGCAILSLGASLDFYLGKVKRAPPWMRRSGLELLYRLLQEPRRLARRYLWDDPRFLGILWQTRRLPAAERYRT